MTEAAFKTSLAVTFVAVILSLSAIPAHAHVLPQLEMEKAFVR